MGVTFPLVTTVSQLESGARHQVHRLGRRPGPPQAGTEGQVPDLDRAHGGVDAQVGAPTVRRPLDVEGPEQGIGRTQPALDLCRHLRPGGEGPVGHVGPGVGGVVGERLPQGVHRPGGQRHHRHPAALHRPVRGEGHSPPVRQRCPHRPAHPRIHRSPSNRRSMRARRSDSPSRASVAASRRSTSPWKSWRLTTSSIGRAWPWPRSTSSR